MGRYAPRIVSPISGEEEAAPSGQGYAFTADSRNLSRWRDWWRKANIEQFVSFVVIGALTITVFSLVARSTVFGTPGIEDADFAFIQVEGDALKSSVGARDLPVRRRDRDRRLPFAPGRRRAARRLPEGLAALDREPPVPPRGLGHAPVRLRRPPRRLRPAAHAPAPLRIRGVRLGVMVWAIGLFGVLSVIVIVDQFGELF